MIPSKPPFNQPPIQQCLRVKFVESNTHTHTFDSLTHIQLIFIILKLELKLRLRLQATTYTPTHTHPYLISYLLPTINKPVTSNHALPAQAPPIQDVHPSNHPVPLLPLQGVAPRSHHRRALPQSHPSASLHLLVRRQEDDQSKGVPEEVRCMCEKGEGGGGGGVGEEWEEDGGEIR